MKKITISAIAIVLSGIAVCQSNPIEFQGGRQALDRILAKNIIVDDRKVFDSSRYFEVFMSINKAGHIGQVLITSVYDSSKMGLILLVIKKTQDKWINHTGTDQLVSLPIYIYFESDNDVLRRNPKIFSQQFLDWDNRPMINLVPFVVNVYPTLH
jgi:hypothetical protein